MTIGKKLGLLSGALLLLNLLLGASALIYFGNLGEEVATLTGQVIPGVHLAGRINTGAKAIILRIHRHMSSRQPEQMAKFEAYLTDRDRQVRAELKAYGDLQLSGKQRQLLERITRDLDGTLAVWNKVRPVSLSGQKQRAVDLFDKEGVKLTEDLDDAAKDLVALNKAESDAVGVQAQSKVAAARAWISGMVGFSFLCGGGLVVWLMRGLKQSLSQMVRELSEGAHRVRTAAARIANTSQSLARAATRQAESLGVTSAAESEISATASLNAEHSHAVVGLVEQSQTGFRDANASLEQMALAMADIDASSGKISRIIKVIDEIAFQTNILALNAAVEAARAGEAGLGFAVVAGEVRNLAQRSAQAARDTAELIEESIAKSRGGRGRMDHVMKAIQAVGHLSEQVQELVRKVHEGSREQAQGIRQMAKAMTDMEQLTRTTAANAEESAAATEELDGQAETMNAMVGRLAAMAGEREK